MTISYSAESEIHPYLNSDVINQKIKQHQNWHVYNDNDNEHTISVSTTESGSDLSQSFIDSENIKSHWFIIKDKKKTGGSYGFYVHSSADTNYVWTRRDNWKVGKVFFS